MYKIFSPHVSVYPLQVYQSDLGQLMFMNKYHGRKLTLAGFKEALYQFFHNGRRLRRELLSPVLRRLCEMQAALEACESYRFYSSSLLIIYDGDPPRTPTRPRHRGGEEGDEDEPSDEEEEEEEEEGAFGFPRSSSASGSASVAGGSSNSGSSRSSHSTGEVSSPMVDVRMIDFAHTTCRHYGEDSVVHEGQDSGFIFGLQNLITIISQLEDHSTDWSCTGAKMVWISNMAGAHWAETCYSKVQSPYAYMWVWPSSAWMEHQTPQRQGRAGVVVVQSPLLARGQGCLCP